MASTNLALTKYDLVIGAMWQGKDERGEETTDNGWSQVEVGAVARPPLQLQGKLNVRVQLRTAVIFPDAPHVLSSH